MKVVTRNPCIQTSAIPQLNITDKERGFIIPGTVSSTGFAEYQFTSTAKEVLLTEIYILRAKAYDYLENQDKVLTGLKSSNRVYALGRTLEHFELPNFLKELQITSKTVAAPESALTPVGWLKTPESGSVPLVAPKWKKAITWKKVFKD
uniref:Putative matrix protein n=1 Tax=Atrato Rhabdo-like virus 2 TaxID=2689334 RepID=A0A6B9KNU2_9RHAB|nr:putative matrix protein [Atrato Rhabdo-like virus 2]